MHRWHSKNPVNDKKDTTIKEAEYGYMIKDSMLYEDFIRKITHENALNSREKLKLPQVYHVHRHGCQVSHHL